MIAMNDLPATTRMRPRPVWARHLRRLQGLPLRFPSEAEQRDAIRVLEECDEIGYETELFLEAFRIFDEAGR